MKPWDECMEDAKTNKMLGGQEGAKMVEVDQFSGDQSSYKLLAP